MSDARLDLEVVINGTGTAASGLDSVAAASSRVGKAAAITTAESRVLTSTISGLSRGAQAAGAAQTAWAQLMAGNLVAAARSATAAIRIMWAAMMSNPVTQIIAGITALVAAGYGLVKWHERAKEAALKQAEAQRQLNDEIARTTGMDPLSIKSEVADRLVRAGDMEKLKQLRDRYAELAKISEDYYRATGQGKERFEELTATANMYAKAVEKTGEAIQEAADKDAEATKEALANAAEKLAAERQLAWEKKRAAEQDLETTRQNISDEEELWTAKSKIEELEIRRAQLLRDLSLMPTNEGDEESEKARLLKAHEIKGVERDILRLKEEAAKATADEGARRATDAAALAKQEELLAGLKAAEAAVLNPGDAERKQRDEEREERKNQLRLKAGLSGNSKEATERRNAYEQAKANYLAWIAGGGVPTAAPGAAGEPGKPNPALGGAEPVGQDPLIVSLGRELKTALATTEGHLANIEGYLQ